MRDKDYLKLKEYIEFLKSEKVVCVKLDDNKWGGCAATKDYLKLNEVYNVNRIIAKPWHTEVWIEGFDVPFNSLNFERYKKERENVD